MNQRRQILIAAAIAPLTGQVFAQGRFPERPIKMVVPFAAGGGTDIAARLIAAQAAQYLGQPIVVDNRGGAAGKLGSEAVAKATPDGYTILMATVSTHAINPALYANLSYDPIKSFTPISLVARVGSVVAVNANMPVKTLGDLAEAMRRNPNGLSFGSAGAGGMGHLMGVMFNSLAGVQSVHVPYKGAGAALQDLLAGNIQIIYDTAPAFLPYVQSGKLRILAVTTPNRIPSLPDVPTTAEAGYPKFLASTWDAILAPANTPAQVIKILNRAMVRAMQDPNVRARLLELSAEPLGSSSAELAEFMKQEIKTWASIIKASGVKIE